ncbi:50S ribosomal protein L21 [Porphyromonadaceae bacterium W3.11]|nr:50S ribosomal protein L21 [Porphyromonadaceae bacterium W3.11]
MYGIVEIQGQQFKVENGQKLFVHHIREAKEGDTIEFDRVLLLDQGNDAVKIGAPTIDGAKVVCEVLKPIVKGEKVLIFKKKRRKGYRRLKGHRQQFTQLAVKEILG